MPINPTAVRLVLTELDRIPFSDRASLFSTKDKQISFWISVTQNQKHRNTLLVSEPNHIPFGKRISLYNDDELRRKFGYTLRDHKQEEYRALKGDRAMTEFFRLGSGMLKTEYLEKIGYRKGVVHEDSREVTPRRTDSALKPIDGGKQGFSAARSRDFSPQALRKRSWGSVSDEVANVISIESESPTILRARKVRGLEHGYTAESILGPSIQGQDSPDQDEAIREAFANVRETIDSAVASFATDSAMLVSLRGFLCSESLLPELERLLAAAIGIASWRHVIADLISDGHMSSTDLFRCLLWTHVISEILEKDDVLDISTSGPVLTHRLVVILTRMMMDLYAKYADQERILKGRLAEVVHTALRLRIRFGANHRVLCPAHGQNAYINPYGSPDQRTAVEASYSFDEPAIKKVLFTRVPGVCRKTGAVVIPAELRLQ